MKLVICISALFLMVSTVSAFECFSCTYTIGNDGYETCINEPWNYTKGAPKVPCNGQCFSQRQIVSEEIFTMSRGCDGGKVMEEGCVSDTCTYICNNDLCNNRDLTYVPKSTTPGSTTTRTPGGIYCYSCDFSGAGTDYSCITSPSKSNKVYCTPDKYCYIHRVWRKQEDKMASFSRSCIPKQLNNGCVDDAEHLTCRTYCKSEFCNHGDGANPPPDPENGQGRLHNQLYLTMLSVLLATVATRFVDTSWIL